MNLKVIFLPVLLWFPSFTTIAQTFTSSNLPIVLINPVSPIQDEIRVHATMKVIDRGSGRTNYVTDKDSVQYLTYNGIIEIEIRGSSSQATPKKQYGFTTLKEEDNTPDNVKLLGLPKENDWVLNGMVFDPAKMRDYLCYNLSRRTGEYASGTVYCELMIGGMYKGIYLLQEKIKADDNRVDVVKMEPTDNEFPDISGGYIVKADKTTGGDPVAWTMYSLYNAPVNYIHVMPKPEEITPAQHEYIRKEFTKLASLAQYGQSDIAGGYPSVIDIPSFIHYMVISELSSNADAYMFSSHFHKDRNGKLRAGPVWDGDLTFGNDLFFWGLDRSHTDVWQFNNHDNDGSRFWIDLFNNNEFRCYFSRRWNQLTGPGQPLHRDTLFSFIDKTAVRISEAVERDRILWNSTESFSTAVEGIKNWLTGRINWITANIGPYSGCAMPEVPPLVISKIMYHPDTTDILTESDEQEFLEITNNGEEVIDLTGCYFRGTGLVYQFPAYTQIGPHGTFVLAADAQVFFSKHGALPNGVFTRHLSNNEQDIILSDAFGNTIDSVHYQDTIPWPEADGNGKYLQLTSADADNSMASNWISSVEEIVVSDYEADFDDLLKVFPNPVIDEVMIISDIEITGFYITDMQGKVILSGELGARGMRLDIGFIEPGTYILKLISGNRVFTRKIVKTDRV